MSGPMNDREHLHKVLDSYIDRAEKKGHKLAFCPITGLVQSIKGRKKKDPGNLKLELTTEITMDSFAPEHRQSLNHLYDEKGKLDMGLLTLIGFPAKTLADYEEDTPNG